MRACHVLKAAMNPVEGGNPKAAGAGIGAGAAKRSGAIKDSSATFTTMLAALDSQLVAYHEQHGAPPTQLKLEDWNPPAPEYDE